MIVLWSKVFESWVGHEGRTQIDIHDCHLNEYARVPSVLMSYEDETRWCKSDLGSHPSWNTLKYPGL